MAVPRLGTTWTSARYMASTDSAAMIEVLILVSVATLRSRSTCSRSAMANTGVLASPGAIGYSDRVCPLTRTNHHGKLFSGTSGKTRYANSWGTDPGTI